MRATKVVEGAQRLFETQSWPAAPRCCRSGEGGDYVLVPSELGGEGWERLAELASAVWTVRRDDVAREGCRRAKD